MSINNDQHYTLRAPYAKRRVALLLFLVAVSTVAMSSSFHSLFVSDNFVVLEWVRWSLVTIMFVWLSFSFWGAVAGFICLCIGRDPNTLKKHPRGQPSKKAALRLRHAIIMPIYNEDTNRVMAGFSATVQELLDHQLGEHFDFYLLSDTQDLQIAKAEEQGMKMLRRLLGHKANRVHYRRRQNNWGKKVGNVKDFCQNWGYRYESMIVLDADSMMTAKCMISLVEGIEQNPDVALIQTVPKPVRQHSLFGRFTQFASHLYTPVLATGLSFWQSDNANFWGHNAAIRIAPFLTHCGLPKLESRSSLQGDFLSHDFVEAALLARAGWKCFLLPHLAGSYEEVPSNIIDFIARDKRWMKGNLQHLLILGSKGLSLRSNIHLLGGALAYLMAPILMLFLMSGTLLSIMSSFEKIDFFPSEYALFPHWDVVDETSMIGVLVCTLGFLFVPKLLSLLWAISSSRQAFGGARKLICAALWEWMLAALLAPIMMVYHSYLVVITFLGATVAWNAQSRAQDSVSIELGVQYTKWCVALGLSWLAIALSGVAYGTLWYVPLIVGLVLSPLVVCITSRQFTRNDFWLIPEEITLPRVIKRTNRRISEWQYALDAAALPELPERKWLPMPIQQLKRASGYEFGGESLVLPERVS